MHLWPCAQHWNHNGEHILPPVSGEVFQVNGDEVCSRAMMLTVTERQGDWF
jgi:hypothetical protein